MPDEIQSDDVCQEEARIDSEGAETYVRLEPNVWKVIGLTFVTWLFFSILGKFYTIAMQTLQPEYSLIDGLSVVWSWMSLLFSIILTVKLKKPINLLWGVIAFILCLIPVLGIFVGIAYFAWSYAKLERHYVILRRQH